jgi:enterochelin esterase-like enzyme
MSRLSLFAISLIFAPLLSAQAPPAPAGRGGRGNASPAIKFCEVAPDRTVTFRLRAPEATDVKVSGDFVQGAQDLKKADDGVWSVTVGPLAPAIYSYNFRIHGVNVLDPVNPAIKLGESGSSSMFEVPGDTPAPYDMQNVAHGTVHENWYQSKTLNVWRRIDVYTPPGYETAKAFENDLLKDVMPFAEKFYRISAKPADRAIAGLSMGGGQALSIGLNHLDIFHAVGAFSAGGGVRADGMEAQYKDLLADPAATNRKLKLFYIACGKADSLFAGSQALHDTLAKHDIKHTFAPSEEGHVWRNWRNYLADFVPQLFR